MSCVKSLWFLLVVTLFYPVHNKKLCDYEDADCMTKAARRVFKLSFNGFKDVLEPSDKLYVKEVKGKIEPDLKYTISNATMSRIQYCEVTQLRCYPKDLTFDYHLFCPQLFLNYAYEGKGTLGTENIDGEGLVKLTLDDYEINIKGGYENSISEKDHKLRSTITDYVVKTVPNGKLTFNITNLVRGNKEKSDHAEAYINENWREMETYLRSLIEAFMKQLFDKFQIILKNFPAEDINFYE